VSGPNFLLSQEHEEFRDALRRFAEKEIAPHAADADEREAYPKASLDAFRDSGFVRALYPAEHGGDAGDLLTTALVVEEVARACGSTALTALVTRTGVTALLAHGSKELQQRVLPPIVAGEQQASYCLSESNAGSDAASMTMKAVRDGDQWVLNGRKAWITSAGVSAVYTVFAKTDAAAGHRGITAFVVERDRPGLSVGKLERKMGLRGSPTGEVVLEDVTVPAENLIGDEGRGFHYALEALDRSRPVIAAQALGLAQGALDVAGAYVLERRQFDQRIADFQGVQFMLADMATQLEAARLLVYAACARVDTGAPGITKGSSMAKLFATDTAMRVATDAVQLLGGAGTTREFPVERMMRDVKITQIYEGTNQIQRVVIARKLLDELAAGS
jgi:alkylation response protein AidB-like acyl-CoA dehydrogenase